MTNLAFLALHPAVAVLAVLAVVAPVPGQAVAVRLDGLAPVTVETSHPALSGVLVLATTANYLLTFP